MAESTTTDVSLHEAVFEEPADILIWASRAYLLAATNDVPVPREIPDTFEEGQLGYIYAALVRMMNRLATSTTVPLSVHGPSCPCRSLHEQAFVTALRCLQKRSTAGYCVALTSILPPTIVRLAFNDMSIIASGLSDIERFWPMATATVGRDKALSTARHHGFH